MKTPDQVRQRAAVFYSRNHRSWLAGEFKMLTINLDPPTGGRQSVMTALP